MSRIGDKYHFTASDFGQVLLAESLIASAGGTDKVHVSYAEDDPCKMGGLIPDHLLPAVIREAVRKSVLEDHGAKLERPKVDDHHHSYHLSVVTADQANTVTGHEGFTREQLDEYQKKLRLEGEPPDSPNPIVDLARRGLGSGERDLMSWDEAVIWNLGDFAQFLAAEPLQDCAVHLPTSSLLFPDELAQLRENGYATTDSWGGCFGFVQIKHESFFVVDGILYRFWAFYTD